MYNRLFKIPFLISFLACWLLFAGMPAQAQELAQQFSSQATWLGLPVKITVWAKDMPAGQTVLAASQAELDRLEQKYSAFRQGSVVNELNQYAGERPIPVDQETISLLQWSEDITRCTNGVFDITVASYKWEYGFGQADFRIPPDLRLQQIQPLVDHSFLVIYPKERTVMFKRQGMQLDLDAVLTNYVFNRLQDIWQSERVAAAICQIGSSRVVYGQQLPAGASTWEVPFPGQKNFFFTSLSLKPGKWLYADIFQRAFEKDGKHIHPFLEAKSGRPAYGILGAMLYLPPKPKLDLPIDALILLAPEESVRLVESIPRAEYIIIEQNNKIWRSPGWARLECHVPPEPLKSGVSQK